ncbi:MAG: hypothetical protein ABGY95_02685 [Rubritalea sp.]|uniref:hypothetical protein n=1 Tax=Rubritalea sp. TaxID=2109375 RepID=UPI003241F5BE
MFRVHTKMSWGFKAILGTAILTSWTTGLGFYILNNYMEVEGDFGPEKHPFQFSFLKVHGASAFVMLVIYGYLLASHVPIGLKAKRERMLGLLLTFTQALLIFTAYYLYYGKDEDRRELMAWTHFSIGFFYPMIIVLHIFVGRRSSRQRRIKRKEKARLGSIS